MTRVVALDVGTSSVRARVYDARGEPERDAWAQEAYEPDRGRGFDADRLVAATRAALERVRAAAGPVDAVGGSCFWHGLVAVDRRGRALTPVSTWLDAASAPQAERLARQLGADALHARTGCYPHPSYWPARLARMAEADPDLYRSAARFLSCSDYLQLQLVGDARTSLSMASGTGLLDLASGRWDEELLARLGLDPERLPEISDEPVGEREPWYPALGDGACANVGTGCAGRSRAALTIGTSGAFRTVFESARPEPRRGLFLYRLDGRRVCEGGALSDGGNLYAWLRRTLRLGSAEGMAAREADGHGLTFLPLLGGERSPGWKAAARGAVAGLTLDTSPEDLLQAALEGVAMRFAEVVALMPEVEEVVGSGHALLADPDWAQILADVLGRPIAASTVEEASARGAAVVTLERLGAAPAPAPVGRVFAPREERTETYRLARERQRNLYEGVT